MDPSLSNPFQAAEDTRRCLQLLEAIAGIGQCERAIAETERLVAYAQLQADQAGIFLHALYQRKIKDLQGDIRKLKAYRAEIIRAAGLRVKGNIFYQG